MRRRSSVGVHLAISIQRSSWSKHLSSLRPVREGQRFVDSRARQELFLAGASTLQDSIRTREGLWVKGSQFARVGEQFSAPRHSECEHWLGPACLQNSEPRPVGVTLREALLDKFLTGRLQLWNDKENKASPGSRHSSRTESLWSDLQCNGKPRAVESVDGFRGPYQHGFHRDTVQEEIGRAHDEGRVVLEGQYRLCEEGHLGETFTALDLMVQRGYYVPVSLFYPILKKCTAQKDGVVGRRVHVLIRKCGCELSKFLANHIIRMYASEGNLQEALQVFHKQASPDAFIWLSIISAHVECGQPAKALELYQHMQDSGVKPNSYIFVAALKACACAADLESGKRVHADVMESACVPDIFIGNCVVDMYAKCGSLSDARKVFDSLGTKNVVTWTTMLSAYVQHGLGQEALTLYAGMRQEGITPANHVTFVCLVKACASVAALLQGQAVHREIQERGLDTDVVIGSSLIDMYARCGSLEDARKVFDSMQTKNVVSWTIMIGAYAQQGLSQEALTLYWAMQEEGTTLADRVTFLCLLKACASAKALREGKQLHSHIRERRLHSDVVVGNCLVDMYAKCGSLEDARRVFDGLARKDVVTWTAMVQGYVEHGFGQEALGLYASMQQEDVTPANHVTFVCLLKACAAVGALHQGRQLHKQIQERGLESDVAVGNSLVDMYAKCGRLDDAHKLFDLLPTRDVVSWTALLNGYAQHNDSHMAVQCFREMQQQRVKPDGNTFICLLSACCHDGLVEQGREYFTAMSEQHGIEPGAHHLSCMVDLLGRAGHLEEAESMLLRASPYQNDVVGWRSLLSSCRAHNDIARASRCFDHLIQQEPQNAVAYVLLAGMYSSAGMREEAEQVEALRVAAGACKKPAKAWIEIDSSTHTFVVGDDKDHISSKLRSVNAQMQEGDVESGSAPPREDALCGHAEKLALAYGLLHTPDGATLLVTKNLRMCDDCHRGTKAMSRIEKREIIVRDAHRVHHFVDGFCSCGDRH